MPSARKEGLFRSCGLKRQRTPSAKQAAFRYARNISGLSQVAGLTSKEVDIGLRWRHDVKASAPGTARKGRATRNLSFSLSVGQAPSLTNSSPVRLEAWPTFGRNIVPRPRACSVIILEKANQS